MTWQMQETAEELTGSHLLRNPLPLLRTNEGPRGGVSLLLFDTAVVIA